MGVEIYLLKKDSGTIPEDKREEFTSRLETLLRAGGMAWLEDVSLCGKRIRLLRRINLEDDRVFFDYNFYGSERWESSMYSKQDAVLGSGKVGHNRYLDVMAAAYLLYIQYLDCPGVAEISGFVVSGMCIGKKYSGWLNYLFDAKYSLLWTDPWDMYVSLKDEMNEGKEYLLLNVYKKVKSYYNYHNMIAVMLGIDEYIAMCEKTLGGGYYTLVKTSMRDIQKYKTTADLDENEQLEMFLDAIAAAIRKFRKNEDVDMKKIVDIPLHTVLFAYEIPQINVQILAEQYGKDFWELWEEVGKRAGMAPENRERMDDVIEPIPTHEFLSLSPDDTIFEWREDRPIEFTEEMEHWLTELRERFDKLMEEDTGESGGLKWLVELISEEQDAGLWSFPFADFFEETVEHLSDKRYICLWKIFEQLLHDPELMNEPEKTLDDMFREDRMPRNDAQQKLKRYNEIMANRELRKRVFGF